MGQITLSGSLTFGPASGGSGTFPSSEETIPLETTPSPKQYGCATGVLQRTISSPTSYTTLTGIGATDTVTQCCYLYFRANAAMTIRLTFVDPAGGADIVSILPIQGTITLEPSTSGYLKLLEAKGSAQIEYSAAGLQ